MIKLQLWRTQNTAKQKSVINCKITKRKHTISENVNISNNVSTTYGKRQHVNLNHKGKRGHTHKGTVKKTGSESGTTHWQKRTNKKEWASEASGDRFIF